MLKGQRVLNMVTIFSGSTIIPGGLSHNPSGAAVVQVLGGMSVGWNNHTLVQGEVQHPVCLHAKQPSMLAQTTTQ